MKKQNYTRRDLNAMATTTLEIIAAKHCPDAVDSILEMRDNKSRKDSTYRRQLIDIVLTVQSGKSISRGVICSNSLAKQYFG